MIVLLDRLKCIGCTNCTVQAESIFEMVNGKASIIGASLVERDSIQKEGNLFLQKENLLELDLAIKECPAKCIKRQ